MPSRYLFPLKPAAPGSGVVAFVVLFALLAGVLYGAYRLLRDFCEHGESFYFRRCAVCGAVERFRDCRQPQAARKAPALAQARQGESICQFARAFPRRDVDAWVIRAVWETVMAWGGRDLVRLNFPCGRTTAWHFLL
jgi:hypothetical protein